MSDSQNHSSVRYDSIKAGDWVQTLPETKTGTDLSQKQGIISDKRQEWLTEGE